MTTIETDKQFTAALVAIGKKNNKCLVGVEFDVDEMDGFRVHTRVSTFIICLVSFLTLSQPVLTSDKIHEGEDELLFGTQV